MKNSKIENNVVIDAVKNAVINNDLESDELYNTVRNELGIGFAKVASTIQAILKQEKLVLTSAEKHSIIESALDENTIGIPDLTDYTVYNTALDIIQAIEPRLTKRDLTGFVKLTYSDFKAPRKPVEKTLTDFETALNMIVQSNSINEIDVDYILNNAGFSKNRITGSGKRDLLAVIKFLQINEIDIDNLMLIDVD